MFMGMVGDPPTHPPPALYWAWFFLPPGPLSLLPSTWLRMRALVDVREMMMGIHWNSPEAHVGWGA